MSRLTKLGNRASSLSICMLSLGPFKYDSPGLLEKVKNSATRLVTGTFLYQSMTGILKAVTKPVRIALQRS